MRNKYLPQLKDPRVVNSREQLRNGHEIARQIKSGKFNLEDYSFMAAKVILRFGGARRLCEAIRAVDSRYSGLAPSTVYRWAYPRRVRGGQGGCIPPKMHGVVLKAARYAGVLLKPTDLFSRHILEGLSGDADSENPGEL